MNWPSEWLVTTKQENDSMRIGVSRNDGASISERFGRTGVPPYGALPVQATEREYLKNVAEALQAQLGEIKRGNHTLTLRNEQGIPEWSRGARRY